jgi:hypothetical protein
VLSGDHGPTALDPPVVMRPAAFTTEHDGVEAGSASAAQVQGRLDRLDQIVFRAKVDDG